MKKTTCKDRIEAHKDSRMEDLKEFKNTPDILGDGSNFYDYALSWDFVEPHTYEDQPIGYFRYQISSGGPSEELWYYLNRSQTAVKSVKFWLLDWFDGLIENKRALTAKCAMRLRRRFGDGGSIELTGDDLDVAMWVAHMHHIETEAAGQAVVWERDYYWRTLCGFPGCH